MNKKVLIILGAVLILAFSIRIFKVDKLSLYGDELTILYDSYSILKTGHDQTGLFLPLTFPMGAGRPGGYVYATVPFVAVFGLSEFAVRGVSLFSGLGIIILVFLLCRKFFSTTVGLIAALAAAINPWEISLSRGGFEAHFALFLTLLGLVLVLFKEKKPLFLVLSSFLFGIAIHTYPTFKVTLPLLILGLVSFCGFREFFSKRFRVFTSISALILFMFGLLAISQSFGHGSETRFSNINIFAKSDEKQLIIQKINLERLIDTFPYHLAWIFHNQITEYSLILVNNYLQNFSPDFLFIRGDQNPRHNMGLSGGFYLIEILTIILGIFFLHSNSEKNKKILKFLIFWVLISPIPTALIKETHFLRSSLMLIPLIIFSAVGIEVLQKNSRYKQILVCVVFAFFIQFIFLAERIYFLSASEFASFWSYSAKVAYDIAKENQSRYKYVFLSDRIDNIEFAYPVYGTINPQDVILQQSKKTKIEQYDFKKFDNVFIGSIPQTDLNRFLNSLNSSVIYIGPADDQKFFSFPETIIGPDKVTALTIKRI